MALCSSPYQSLRFLADTEASLTASRIPHAFTFVWSNIILRILYTLFHYEKYINFDPAVGFPICCQKRLSSAWVFPLKINHSDSQRA